MKTFIRKFVSVFIMLLLPAAVLGESLADRKLETPVETWGNEEAELERAILTETVEPTAAGHSTDQPSQYQTDKAKKHRSGGWHGGKQYKNAYEYKREVFGPN